LPYPEIPASPDQLALVADANRHPHRRFYQAGSTNVPGNRIANRHKRTLARQEDHAVG